MIYNNIEAPITVYFDMDGVLAKYEREAYEPVDDPPFRRPDAHYFKNVEPDERAINLIRRFKTGSLLHNNIQYEVYISSSLFHKGSIAMEHYQDKLLWIKKYLPAWEYRFRPVFSCYRKTSVCLANRSFPYFKDSNTTVLHPYEVLIDDWHMELNEWRSLGGTAIKYCNGINNPDSYTGPVFDLDMSTDEMFQAIALAARCYSPI